MEPSSTLEIPALGSGLTALRQVNALYLASTVIMVFDWLLTLDLEVSEIWKSRWNVTKALYLLARYLPFVDIPILLYHQFAPSPPLRVCDISYKYQAWVFVVGSAVSELVLTVRTWAVWNKNRRLTFGLFGTLALTTATEFYLVNDYLSSAHHIQSPVPHLVGCLMVPSSSKLAICFAIFMAFDGCILALMVVRGVAAVRSGGDSRLMRIVYGDGVIYYVYIFGLSLINVVIIYKLPMEYTTLLVIMEGVMHSVLACRVILHIREQVHAQQEISTFRGDSTGDHSHSLTGRSFKDSA